ncbi:hypothetical protein HY637_05550 [Candidatus Woesearchaeota archaeon]|nr:hypothetical protein [Candidatus Woesearchaeota archaeon]
MAFLEKVPILKKLVDTGYAILLVIVISALVGLILAFPVKLLWNYVFGKYLEINWFEAWALNVLTGILFGQRISSK